MHGLFTKTDVVSGFILAFFTHLFATFSSLISVFDSLISAFDKGFRRISSPLPLRPKKSKLSRLCRGRLQKFRIQLAGRWQISFRPSAKAQTVREKRKVWQDWTDPRTQETGFWPVSSWIPLFRWAAGCMHGRDKLNASAWGWLVKTFSLAKKRGSLAGPDNQAST
jgi:hypothetical protein